MENERRYLKIQALHTMGEALKAAQKVLEAERAAGVAAEKLVCIEEHVKKIEGLYDECLECCLEDIRG